MLKKLALGAIGSVLCSLLVTLWIVPSIREARAADAPASSTAIIRSSTAYLYRVGIYNGCVAVFEQNSTKPFFVLDTPVNTLPEHDRVQLESGITVYSAAELQALLEDYS